MKIQLTFKTPDVMDTLINLDDEDLINEVTESLEKWIKYKEYITVEFDTEKDTATVVEPN